MALKTAAFQIYRWLFFEVDAVRPHMYYATQIQSTIEL